MFSKLIAVQTALKAPKGQFNKFGGYAYRSCEDILEAVKPLLAEQGLLLTLTDELFYIGEGANGRFYVKAKATVSDGEREFSCAGFAREPESKKGMDASQITGTASSYARKYALNALFLIDDTKDADATNDHGRKQPQHKPQQPSRLRAACDRLQAACTAYEGKHDSGKPAGWAMDGVKSRPDFPAKDAPADERAAWFEKVAAEFEMEVG